MGDRYRVCAFCVMDTSDPEITFDSAGRCNHCIGMEAARGKSWFSDDSGHGRLQAALAVIRADGEGKEYDSILGLSGGADSSYVALKAHDWGLRPLVVHVDAGWNSELAVANIKSILDYTGWELHTRVINWEDMRDLHLAYLKSGIANQDVPQDHAFFAGLYHFATRNRIRTVLNGGNAATEGIFPETWHAAAMDARNLKAIHDAFGHRELRDYPTISFSQYYIWYPLVKRMSPFRPLNLINYDKSEAMIELENRVGWRPYPRKHGESIFTKFFQNYYLPERFGFDKRRPHFSSQIVSGQLSRDDALLMLDEPLYETGELRRDTRYLQKKLRISSDEFEELMNVPVHHAGEFANWDSRRDAIKRVQSGVRRVTGRNLSVYS